MQIANETDNLFRLTRYGMVNCFLVRENDGLTRDVRDNFLIAGDGLYHAQQGDRSRGFPLYIPVPSFVFLERNACGQER